ncbi:hypothetical protein DJ018_15300 [Phenylobacterium deserti]|uniref:Type I restriction modification DNA specificity domain-containing protein n=1 Tax=Phenylobacterium deserti TaxID=1914756 RepID=A0A328A9U5_9CAUL|nr:hypothetical protein DJ018_15300 [Phenylobacterium deserti]
MTIDRGMVRRDSLEREISANASDEANLRARAGDIVYNMMRMWQGAYGRAPEDCMVSPAYVVLSARSGYSPRFFAHLLREPRPLYWLWAFSHGLTNDRLRLYYRDFTRVPLHAPSLEEQEKIADMLDAMDARVELLLKRAETLSQYRDGVIQQLFSGELRFAPPKGGAYADWIDARLGEVASFAKGRGVSREDIAPEGLTPCIRYGELYTTYGEVIGQVASRTHLDPAGLMLSIAGDVIVPASGEDPLEIASAACVLQDGVALGGDLNIIRSSLDGVFLAYLLRNAKRLEIARLAQGYSVVHLYPHHLKRLKIRFPAQIEEQRHIAAFLQALDRKVAAVRAQAAATRTFKAGLAQRLFV